MTDSVVGGEISHQNNVSPQDSSEKQEAQGALTTNDTPKNLLKAENSQGVATVKNVMTPS